MDVDSVYVDCLNHVYINVFILGPFPVCNLSLFLTCVQAWKSKYFYFTVVRKNCNNNTFLH